MKAILKGAAVTVLAVILAGAGLALYYMARTGAFTAVENLGTGACRAVALDGPSAEDIVVDRGRGIAYISALDRRGQVAGTPSLGTVLKIDLTSDAPVAMPALAADPPSFKPHGMSLFEAPDGSQTLFVISHPPAQDHTVEVFERAADGLFVHRETVRGAGLFKPNDLAAVGPREFYVANDSGAETVIQTVREQLFGAGLAALAHYDGREFRILRRDLAAAGGINVSADGARVFVADTQQKRVRIFGRDRVTGNLELAAAVELDGLPDNIDVAPDGGVWVTAHVSAVALVRHFIDPANASPSRVYRIALDERGFWRAQLKYASDGANLSAGSVAVPYAGQLVLGSITERKILLCSMAD